MDWGKYPARYKDKIDTWGVNGDCDDLQWEADNWWQKDRALGEYIYEWFKRSGLCVDVYYTPKCRRQGASRSDGETRPILRIWPACRWTRGSVLQRSTFLRFSGNTQEGKP